MLSRVLRTINEHGLFASGESVLVAVSGGPDSTALLHALVHLAPRLGLRLATLTVDHGMRPESADEAAGVAARCRALGLAAEVVRVDVRAERKRHVSWQEAARAARMHALHEVADRTGCSRVALGHNADDQAETVLFRIVRGTGVAGLAGIPFRRERFVRPLLDVRRAEILAFLSRRKIAFVSDPSNADRRYTRVRVREEWLPMLARENPRVVEAILALAHSARESARDGAGSHRAAGRFVPRRAAETVHRLVREGRGTRRVAVGDGDLVVSYGRVCFEPRVARGGQPAAAGMVTVAGPGRYSAGPPGQGPGLLVEEGRGVTPAPEGGAAMFDVEQIVSPLIVRVACPGDRMRPRGGRGSKKLSRLLIDAKVPRPQRALLPVLVAADGTVLFVPGLRPAETGRPGVQTRRWLRVSAVC